MGNKLSMVPKMLALTTLLVVANATREGEKTYLHVRGKDILAGFLPKNELSTPVIFQELPMKLPYELGKEMSEIDPYFDNKKGCAVLDKWDELICEKIKKQLNLDDDAFNNNDAFCKSWRDVQSQNIDLEIYYSNFLPADLQKEAQGYQWREPVLGEMPMESESDTSETDETSDSDNFDDGTRSSNSAEPVGSSRPTSTGTSSGGASSHVSKPKFKLNLEKIDLKIGGKSKHRSVGSLESHSVSGSGKEVSRTQEYGLKHAHAVKSLKKVGKNTRKIYRALGSDPIDSFAQGRFKKLFEKEESS